MGVGIGLGCAEFPFSGAAAYWRWIDMCEAGGVDSIWQTDRIVGRQPFGGYGMSGVGSKAGGPDYLLQFLDPRTITENTVRQGFAAEE